MTDHLIRLIHAPICFVHRPVSCPIIPSVLSYSCKTDACTNTSMYKQYAWLPIPITHPRIICCFQSSTSQIFNAWTAFSPPLQCWPFSIWRWPIAERCPAKIHRPDLNFCWQFLLSAKMIEICRDPGVTAKPKDENTPFKRDISLICSPEVGSHSNVKALLEKASITLMTKWIPC